MQVRADLIPLSIVEYVLATLALGFAMQFTAPNSAQRITAIGSTEALPETLRRAFDPRDDFQPLPAPGPSDWLANHPERGQTFDQFVRSHPNRPDATRGKLYLLPLGNFARGSAPPIDQLVRFTAAFFEMDVEALPPVDLARVRVTSRRNPSSGQTQLLTTDLLDLLRTRLPSDAFALLGITMIDLYPDPNWNFVFGQASLRDRVGVYSFARYQSSFYGQAARANEGNIMLRRSCRVLAHEAGHMFGIEHCIWFRCLMNGSNHLGEADARPLHLCPVDLHKLQWSIGFDVETRYRRLLEFDRQAAFDDEVQWLEKRMRFIESK